MSGMPITLDGDICLPIIAGTTTTKSRTEPLCFAVDQGKKSLLNQYCLTTMIV